MMDKINKFIIVQLFKEIRKILKSKYKFTTKFCKDSITMFTEVDYSYIVYCTDNKIHIRNLKNEICKFDLVEPDLINKIVYYYDVK